MANHNYVDLKTTLSKHLPIDVIDKVLTFLLPYAVPQFNTQLLDNMDKTLINGSKEFIHNRANKSDVGTPLFYLQHKVLDNRLYILGYRKEDTLASNLKYLEAYNNYINVNRHYFIAQLPIKRDYINYKK